MCRTFPALDFRPRASLGKETYHANNELLHRINCADKSRSPSDDLSLSLREIYHEAATGPVLTWA